MKIRIEEIVRLCFIILIGAALLMLSAVAENGETQMSRTLISNMEDVPKMIEALAAGMAITVGGGAAGVYLEYYL